MGDTEDITSKRWVRIVLVLVVAVFLAGAVAAAYLRDAPSEGAARIGSTGEWVGAVAAGLAILFALYVSASERAHSTALVMDEAKVRDDESAKRDREAVKADLDRTRQLLYATWLAVEMSQQIDPFQVGTVGNALVHHSALVSGVEAPDLMRSIHAHLGMDTTKRAELQGRLWNLILTLTQRIEDLDRAAVPGVSVA